MIIVKTLAVEPVPQERSLPAVWTSQESPAASGGTASCSQRLAPVDPALGVGYFGLKLVPLGVQQQSGIALLQRDRYYDWNGTEWSPTDAPVYRSLEDLLPLLSFWHGQLQIELENAAGISQVEVAYGVNIDLEDWLLRFGLRDLLAPAVNLTVMEYCRDGEHINLPENLSSIESIAVQPVEQAIVETIPAQDCLSYLHLSQPITPGPVQLHCKIAPPIDYIEREHQASELPCVTIEKLFTSSRRAAYREEVVWGTDGSAVADRHIYAYDLVVEVSVIAHRVTEARSLARAYMSRINDNGALFAPPFDLTFGVAITGNLVENPEDKQEATLASVSFTLKLCNLPFSDASVL